MFGIIVGTACLVAFLVVLRHGGQRHYTRSAKRWLFRRLDTSVEQEKVVRHAFLSVKEHAKRVVKNQSSTRRELADLMRAQSFDEQQVTQWFAAREHELSQVRDTAVRALGEVHEVLDNQQRETLAGLIERGSCWPRRTGLGPYRQPPEAP